MKSAGVNLGAWDSIKLQASMRSCFTGYSVPSTNTLHFWMPFGSIFLAALITSCLVTASNRAFGMVMEPPFRTTYTSSSFYCQWSLNIRSLPELHGSHREARWHLRKKERFRADSARGRIGLLCRQPPAL